MEVNDLAYKLQLDLSKIMVDSLRDNLDQYEFTDKILQYMVSIPKYDSTASQQIFDVMNNVYKKLGYQIQTPSSIKFLDIQTKEYMDLVLSKLPIDLQPTYNLLTTDVLKLVQSGGITRTQAVDSIIKNADFRGVTVFDKAGRKQTIKTIVQRQIRDALRSANLLSAEEIANKINTNVFEISSHPDPRIKCSQDEGKYVSDVARTITDLYDNPIRVVSWADTTYGQIDGLFGINCRHSKWPVVPGFKIPVKNSNPIKTITNKFTSKDNLLNEELKQI